MVYHNFSLLFMLIYKFIFKHIYVYSYIYICPNYKTTKYIYIQMYAKIFVFIWKYINI